MAKVWMDDYIDLFYMNRPDLRTHPGVGDVTHRMVLREKLKCKSFEWFLQNVFPEKFIPTKNVQAYGRVNSKSQNLCFDDLQQNVDEPYNLGVYPCHKPHIMKSQFFSLTDAGLLRNEETCATIQNSSSSKKNIVMIRCRPNSKHEEKWEITADDQLRNIQKNLCIDHAGLNSQDYLYATKCDNDSETQKWEIVH